MVFLAIRLLGAKADCWGLMSLCNNGLILLTIIFVMDL